MVVRYGLVLTADPGMTPGFVPPSAARRGYATVPAGRGTAVAVRAWSPNPAVGDRSGAAPPEKPFTGGAVVWTASDDRTAGDRPSTASRETATFGVNTRAG